MDRNVKQRMYATSKRDRAHDVRSYKMIYRSLKEAQEAVDQEKYLARANLLV